MPPRRIADASPLILLAKAGRLDLLRLGDVEVVVPDVVAREVGVKGPHDPSALAVSQADWLTIRPVPAIPDPVRSCHLDLGETAVLALAHGDPDAEVVLDDRAGRRCAARLGVPCLGTLGLVLLGKRLGLVSDARPVIERLMQVGLFLDVDFVDEILERIGE